jgi:hypothetical protein
VVEDVVRIVNLVVVECLQQELGDVYRLQSNHLELHKRLLLYDLSEKDILDTRELKVSSQNEVRISSFLVLYQSNDELFLLEINPTNERLGPKMLEKKSLGSNFVSF